MLTVFGAIAQLKRKYILDRQREGIEIARQNGKYKGRKPIAVDEEKFAGVYARWKAREIQGGSGNAGVRAYAVYLLSAGEGL